MKRQRPGKPTCWYSSVVLAAACLVSAKNCMWLTNSDAAAPALDAAAELLTVLPTAAPVAADEALAATPAATEVAMVVTTAAAATVATVVATTVLTADAPTCKVPSKKATGWAGALPALAEVLDGRALAGWALGVAVGLADGVGRGGGGGGGGDGGEGGGRGGGVNASCTS